MPQFTITAVSSDIREYDYNGPKVAYRVRVSGPGVGLDEVLEISQQPETAPPKQGDVIDAELMPSKNPAYPRRLKKVFANRGGGQAGGGTYKPRDPKDTAAIQRQHSQEMALRGLALTGRFEGVDLARGAQEFRTEVQKLADFFDDDIAQGSQRAVNIRESGVVPVTERKGPPVDRSVSDVPAPIDEFAVPSGVANGQGDDIPF